MKRGREWKVLATRATHALRLGHRDEAQALARRALQAGLRKPEALSALADLALALEHETGDSALLDEVATAVTTLDQTPAQRPREASAAWHFRVGWAFARQGKLDEAARAFGAAVALAPDDVDSWRGLARARHSLEDVDGAIEAWQRVIELSPADWEAHNDAGGAFMERNDWARADAAFAAAAELAPDQPIVIVNRATLDVRRGQRRDAIGALEACVARYPDYVPALAGLGFALRDEGRLEQASAVLRRATTLAPDDAAAACALGRALLEGGDAQAASLGAQAFLRRRPGHAGVLALEVQARQAMGDEAAVSYLLDPRFISQAQLATPQGFGELAAFDVALAAHAAAHRTLLSSPASHATAGGLHSGSLLVTPRGPVAAFEQALRVAISTYSRALPSLRGHPFVENRPSVAFFNIWCVVLERGGHQIPHIHPEAWLSGVYYPQVPAAIRTPVDPDDPSGCLELGADDLPGPTRVPPRLIRVRPAEGLLVLFPSYFYHRTVPFDAEGARISVAFDLMPVRDA
jgi:uncharacterized protein (TIGR02466 family)